MAKGKRSGLEQIQEDINALLLARDRAGLLEYVSRLEDEVQELRALFAPTDSSPPQSEPKMRKARRPSGKKAESPAEQTQVATDYSPTGGRSTGLC